jgi:drug/metabolite transporter (DMT)-like permease
MSARPGLSRKVWLALLTVYVVWGSTYLAIRVAVRTLPPFLMAGVRFLVAGGLLYAWAIRRGDAAEDPIGRPQWRSAFLVGGLLLLGGNGGVVFAERVVPSSIAALVVATVPIWMALFAARRGGERLLFKAVVGLALGLAGVVLLVRAGGSNGGFVDPFGVILLVGASVSWAFGSVWARHLPLPRRPLVTTAMEMIGGGALLSLAGVVTGEIGQIDFEAFSASSLLALAYLIVFGSWAGFSAYVYLLHNASTSVASTYAYVNPVIAVFLGWALLSEPVTALTLVAAAMIVGAVVLILRSEERTVVREVAGTPSPADVPAAVEQA